MIALRSVGDTDRALATEPIGVAFRRVRAELEPVLRDLDAAGITLDSIEVIRPTLDDVFLTLTGRSLRDAETERGNEIHSETTDSTNADAQSAELRQQGANR